MLQSAAVWRLMHTADRITKSKYENYCCSPEPPAKSTGPGSGQESLFRGDVDSNVGWLTVLLGQLHMAVNTQWHELRTHNAKEVWTKETKVVFVKNSAENNPPMSKHMTAKSWWIQWINACDAGLFLEENGCPVCCLCLCAGAEPQIKSMT